MTDTYQAFVDKNKVIQPAKEGSLSGLSFAVKDVFHLEGMKNSAGNPDWLRTHDAAKETAPAIKRLLENGAKLEGTTITDEIMYSLQGENFHYGTPVNPRDPTRIPGGSSSGSAVAVAGNITDFSLGTDTGGSVRIPSAYCGIYGFRPTHGNVPIEHVIPLAPSFDTVGWMARDAKTLKDVGKVLLDNQQISGAFSRILFSKDTWELADGDTQKALSPSFSLLEELADEPSWVELAKEGLPFWANAFRIIQGKEIWDAHGDWVKAVKPEFGPGIKERFEMASHLTSMDANPQLKLQDQIRTKLFELLKDDALLILPTVPGEAPMLNLSGALVEARRKQTLQLSCIAGLAGLPQVTIPIESELGNAPVSLSVVAGPNQDIRLLEWMNEFVASEKFIKGRG
ncbi:amidase [Salipaludibacillus neizhouensis]|uniref:Amidase n=1 Tax=Salipaludibacillus neizhouensis TaxID=885475 RepID=A0A3A9K9M9_9BACI|nr:amidase [Salipaludibacillus neizhouensis]RKL68268.1 amidase [Salipaludibacillus neizhouensis]